MQDYLVDLALVFIVFFLYMHIYECMIHQCQMYSFLRTSKPFMFSINISNFLPLRTKSFLFPTQGNKQTSSSSSSSRPRPVVVVVVVVDLVQQQQQQQQTSSSAVVWCSSLPKTLAKTSYLLIFIPKYKFFEKASKVNNSDC